MAPTAGASAKDAEFTEWMTLRYGTLRRRAHLLCGDHATAEDLVQDTLAKMYLAWDKVQSREAVDAYARRVMVNEFNSWWRRPWRRRERSTEQLPEHGVLDDHDEGRSRQLWEFVQTLPPKQRAVIVLRYYEDLSEIEIAETLHISTGTVKSQASRALAALRTAAPDTLGPKEEQS